MESFRIDITLSPKDLIEKMAGDIARRFPRGILRATKAAEAVVVDEAPYKEGNLRHGVISLIQGSGTDAIGYVRVTAPYGPYVHAGTGIYGPHHTPIIPRVKKALAFIYGGRKLVRKSVKGQKPNPFVARAKKKLEDSGTLTLEFWKGFNAGE